MAELQEVINEVCGNRFEASSGGLKVAALLGLVSAVIGGMGISGMFGGDVISNDPFDGLFIAMVVIGWPITLIGLIGWGVNRQEYSTQRRGELLLLSMAKELEEKRGVSGGDYGQFLVTLEHLKRQDVLTDHECDKIIVTLDYLIVKRGRRISGLDYVELEKKLLGAGTVKVKDKYVELFSKLDIERILRDYEKLRKRIRDRRLGELHQ